MTDWQGLLTSSGLLLLGATVRFAVAWLNSQTSKLDPADQEEGK